MERHPHNRRGRQHLQGQQSQQSRDGLRRDPRQGRRSSHTPDVSPVRAAVESRSAPVLLRLRRAPRWLVPLVPVALLLAGLAGPPIAGGCALVVLAGVLGWLGYLSWPSLAFAGRLLRLTALLVLLGLAALRFAGYL